MKVEINQRRVEQLIYFVNVKHFFTVNSSYHAHYLVRNRQVMIDDDLAVLYQVDTSALNRAVKRNSERFPEDFMFQLTKVEHEILRCQIGISKNSDTIDGRGGRRYMPYVFTEQGLAMLSSVLCSDTAAKISIDIMRAFVEMRRFIGSNALLFERISEIELNPGDTLIEQIGAK